jgi:hypothetical protein
MNARRKRIAASKGFFMQYAKAGFYGAILLLCATNSAHAAPNMTCSRAMSLVSNNPGIESASIMSIAAMQWQKMDQITLSNKHPAIAQAMIGNNNYTQMLESQCMENPGQPLVAAAAQVYRQARVSLDGY